MADTPKQEEVLDFIPQARKGREARLGVFVVFGILSLIAVLFMLTDPATLRGRYMLVTVVDDAGGVRRGDPIQMKGVNIGRIDQFEMRPDGQVAISLEVEGKWQIPAGSTTRLGAAGIFGGRTVEILPTTSTENYAEGDTLPGKGGSAGGLMASADELGEKSLAVLDEIRTLLAGEMIGNVQGSVRELESLLSELSSVTKDQRGTLKRLTESLTRSAEGLEGSTPDVARAIARADSAMATLNRTGENLDAAVSSLRSVLDRMDRGEGTLGKLSHDDALYDNLNSAAESVASLLQDLQANPKKYINISIF
jgi:phospholipid/cholesterol/gamma-HCH transport system substrate-binding protein